MNASTRPAVIQNVQVLRAVAAWTCVLAHLHFFVSQATGLKSELGAADLFFVLSGYIMGYATTGANITTRKFVARRIVKIVPLYWFVTLLVYGIALGAHLIGRHTRADFGELLQSLFFIPFAKPTGPVQPTWFVGWTLNYEMLFYAVFAGALFIRNAKLRIIAVMGILSFVAALGHVFKPENVILRFFSDKFLLDFVLGLGIYLALQRLPAAAPKGGVQFMLAAAAAAFIAALILPPMYPKLHTAITCGLATGVIVATFVALERWGWTVTSPTLVMLGNASYSIYLFHPFVTSALVIAGKRMVLNPLECMLFVIAGLILSTILGVVVYYQVERPLGGWAKRLRLPGAPAVVNRQMA